jgi:aminopeptidase N
LSAAAECLSDLGVYLDKAEEVFGEYVWGDYTILVLPPSFPFGGMENPLMTFASPTIIT